jgi:hypothetical protein
MVRICTGSCASEQHAGAVVFGVEVEGVVLLPRGMLWGNVEPGEVEVVGLDVGPLGDGEAHVGEDLGDLVEHLAHRVDAPLLQRSETDRQGHVGGLGGEARAQRLALQFRLAALQGLADAGLQRVDGLPERLALVGGERAQPRHQLGHAPLLAERGNAHALDGVEVARAGDLAQEDLFECAQFGSVGHASGSSSPATAAIGFPSPSCRRHVFDMTRGGVRGGGEARHLMFWIPPNLSLPAC